VAPDEPRGLLPVDPRLERQPVAGHPVDDAVVEHLADVAHLGGDLFWRHAVEPGGAEGVDLMLIHLTLYCFYVVQRAAPA